MSEKAHVVFGTNNVTNQICAQVSFFPNFNEAKIDDAYRASIENQNEFDVKMSRASAEYIFVLDRSGSMDGVRLEKAK